MGDGRQGVACTPLPTKCVSCADLCRVLPLCAACDRSTSDILCPRVGPMNASRAPAGTGSYTKSQPAPVLQIIASNHGCFSLGSAAGAWKPDLESTCPAHKQSEQTPRYCHPKALLLHLTRPQLQPQPCTLCAGKALVVSSQLLL